MNKQKKIEFLKELLKVFEKFPELCICEDEEGNIAIYRQHHYEIEFYENTYMMDMNLLKKKVRELEGEKNNN